MSVVEDGDRGRGDRGGLPDHLTRDANEVHNCQLLADPDRGEAYCVACGARVTVGPSGTEYGHQRYGADGKTRCPHRPTSVDSDRSPTYAERGMEHRKAP